MVYALVPGLGTWKTGPIERSDERVSVHRFRVPRSGRLRGEFLFPPGCSNEAVEGWMELPGFSLDAFGQAGRKRVRRELALDARGRFEVDLFPGEYECFFASEKISGTRRMVRLEEGSETRLIVAPAPGVQVSLRLCFPRWLADGERLDLVAWTPSGPARIAYSRGASHPRRDGSTLDIATRIPSDALELGVSTNRGLEGRIALDPLGPTTERMEITLRVVPDAGFEKPKPTRSP